MILGEHTIYNVMFRDNDSAIAKTCRELVIKEGRKIVFRGKPQDIPKEFLDRFIKRIRWQDSKNTAIKPFDYIINV